MKFYKEALRKFLDLNLKIEIAYLFLHNDIYLLVKYTMNLQYISSL